MTPVRAVFASLFAATILAAGLFIVARTAGASPHDLLSLLSWTRTPFSLWCFLAAWGAAALGVLGVLSAFLAFIAPDEHDDPSFRRRGFPKSAPLLLVATGLGLAYLAFRCAAGGAEAPVAIAVGPDRSNTPVSASAAPSPPVETSAGEKDGVDVAATAFAWRYMDPMVNDAGAVWGGFGPPFADEAENAALLCGKEWVAVTGSASEEGPPDRNARRSRFRAELAMLRAERWLSQHPECGETPVFGVDLGQHAKTASADADATAYQRQILVASKERRGKPSSAKAAEDDLRDFLSEPKNRAAFYAGREFGDDPAILSRQTALAQR